MSIGIEGVGAENMCSRTTFPGRPAGVTTARTYRRLLSTALD